MQTKDDTVKLNILSTETPKKIQPIWCNPSAYNASPACSPKKLNVILYRAA